jgi:hypothetical protein
MSQPDNLSSFFNDNKMLFKEYLEVRLELFRVHVVRLVSQIAGLLAWLLVSVFLLFLIVIFSGIVLGCWFSGLLHSYVLGFGLLTLIMVVLFILLAVFRKTLFVGPVIQAIIRKTGEEFDPSAQTPESGA